MKLAMIRTIAHHTSGDAKPLIPVQENASSGAATSLAPRFKRSSEANTNTTLKPSCSHGFPKPDGRFCIRFSNARSKHRNRFWNGLNYRHAGRVFVKARARLGIGVKLDRAAWARGI